MPDKHRARLLAKERLPLVSNRSEKERLILENFKNILKDKKPKTLLLYKADKWEVSLEPILNWLDSESILTFFPRILPHDDKGLTFLFPESWELGKFGILEPIGIRSISPLEADLAVIPALGFNSNLYRLGRGKGFYDRAMKGMPREKMVGLSYEEVFYLDFPEGEFDIQVGSLITEKRLIF